MGSGSGPPLVPPGRRKTEIERALKESEIRRFRALDVSDREASWNFTRAPLVAERMQRNFSFSVAV
jgi:hypothetical protein